MDVEEVSQSMESGTQDQEDESLVMEIAAETPEMVTEGVEGTEDQEDESLSMEIREDGSLPRIGNSEINEQEECICAVNCAECQPLSRMDEDASLAEVGNNEQNEPEECIYCTIHCSGRGVEGKEEPLSLMCASQPVEMGSVVGVESSCEYPHHYGSGHTPLLSPAIITEKGVELGWVIGLSTTGEQDKK